MYQENMELQIIKHCSNLQRLSVEQLKAIKDGRENLAMELIAQKQIIVDSMVALQEKFDINTCQSETREKVKYLLNQISVIESDSQQVVKERCADISKQMLANRKEINIQQAYEESSLPFQGTLCNIEK